MRWRETYAEPGFEELLLEGRDSLGFVVVGGEKIQQADHFQSLQGEFGGSEKADATACLLGGGEVANQHADAAGIDGGDALEVEDDFAMCLAEQFVEGGVEAIEGGAHAEAPGEFDNFYAIHGFRINVQRRPP